MNNSSQSLLYQVKQDESNPQFLKIHKMKHVGAFFILASLLIAGGTVIWVLNIINIIPGPWSNVFGAVFAGIGIIVTLLNALLALHRS